MEARPIIVTVMLITLSYGLQFRLDSNFCQIWFQLERSVFRLVRNERVKLQRGFINGLEKSTLVEHVRVEEK